MKNIFFLLVLTFGALKLSAQKDTLSINSRYWEDQLYINLTYNTLVNEPQVIESNGFSFGISAGYIKDIPFTIKGNWAAGIGVGYGYNTFNHDLLIDNSGVFSAMNENITSNKLRLHSFEFPLQIRWRNSDVVTYSFWRVYAGVRMSYNISNTFKYIKEENNYSFSNIDAYNNFQSGLELSIGYGAINFFVYYGLTPMYKSATLNGAKINTKIAKFGLIFYLL